MQTLTGVISNNSVEWLGEEMDKGINLDFETHCQECQNDDHESCWEDSPADTWLIGNWRKNRKDQYTPDKTGQYAAITGECYTQVVWSRTKTSVRAMCSPCYPGQADLDSGKGKIRAYTLPADLIGNIA